jgi:(4-(4-[2-(gamma-L-glutamylamino)ethyl]phenoxymethyl)furan-2-yl)methanamine synthase
MTRTILGLDVGGANLKAATPDGRTVGVPFALWKQPDRLPAALAELVGRFPDATELAVTMTGELCDCYETKRQGVHAILDAVEYAAAGRPVRVWGTGGAFLSVAASRVSHLTVAAANWHALATFASRYLPDRTGIVIDIGSTTTDITSVTDGTVTTDRLTDPDRLGRGLAYTGVRRTPLCAVLGSTAAAELFATMHDAYLVTGDLPEEPDNRDTADGRPATKPYALARLARMVCGDLETIAAERLTELARRAQGSQLDVIAATLHEHLLHSGGWRPLPPLVFAGSGEFLYNRLISLRPSRVPTFCLLGNILGPAVSACAPAYAVAVLASERPL